jgi:hypothetical protein
MKTVVVYSRGTDGHRADYNSLLEKEFHGLGVIPQFVTRRSARLLTKTVFFTMIEEDLPMFLLCALAGIFTGNVTIGLFFRVGECFRRNKLKYRIKYLVFWTLRRLRNVKVITILPFTIQPRFAEVAFGSVHDPQLWDSKVFSEILRRQTSPLSEKVLQCASGRKIIVALGGQNKTKGFDYFCEIWCKSEALRKEFLFVAAGKISNQSLACAQRYESAGGLLINRYISANELYSLYSAANVVWSAYSPAYDQASGIAGRAFQFGLPIVSRAGSFIARQMIDLHRPTIEIGFDNSDLAAQNLLTSAILSEKSGVPEAAMSAMQQHFRTVVQSCIGLSESEPALGSN